MRPLPYLLDDEKIQANFDALATLAPSASLTDADVTALRRLSSLIKSGANVPENNVVAAVGTLYLRSDGGENATLYVKETGSGNTGWVAK